MSTAGWVHIAVLQVYQSSTDDEQDYLEKVFAVDPQDLPVQRWADRGYLTVVNTVYVASDSYPARAAAINGT